MKKLTAILLLTLFLLNLFGYRWLVNYAQCKSDIRIEADIDRNLYNDNELIAITVSVSMPYQLASNGFERFDGEITLDGKIYKFVKRKFGEGQVTYLCLPDHHKTRLESVKSSLAAADAQTNDTKKQAPSKSSTSKQLSVEYDHSREEYKIAFCHSLHMYAPQGDGTAVASAMHDSPEQPPEQV